MTIILEDDAAVDVLKEPVDGGDDPGFQTQVGILMERLHLTRPVDAIEHPAGFFSSLHVRFVLRAGAIRGNEELRRTTSPHALKQSACNLGTIEHDQ